MPTARTLRLSSIESSNGRCPWRINYEVDHLSVSAFFRPPEQIEHDVRKSDLALLAWPILCDLVAQVRPKEVRISDGCSLPAYRRVFADAASALLAEQDAFWRRSRWTPLPSMTTTLAGRKRSSRRLDPNRIVLGFSGGKDSILSLFALREAGYTVIPVLLNEGDRTWQDIRKWLPKLRRLGVEPMVAYLLPYRRSALSRRYGDWYFSSYQLGWLTSLLALCADRTGAAVVALGIESSANQTFESHRGKAINHQHQKTTRHLNLIERFLRQTLNDGLRVASPIAGLTDAQVIRILLQRVPAAYRAFSSCGGANTHSKHCGQCEKCAFVYVLLSATKQGRSLGRRLFRRDLLEDVELYRPWLDARFRAPLACIGERREVWKAFESLMASGQMSPVLRHWQSCALRFNFQSSPRGKTAPRQSHRTNSQLTDPVTKAADVLDQWLAD